MLTFKTNSLVMTVLMTLSVMAYSDYSANHTCNEPSYFASTQECYSNNSITLEEFKPSFPH